MCALVAQIIESGLGVIEPFGLFRKGLKPDFGKCAICKPDGSQLLRIHQP